jgi:hypothetical protein
MKFLLVLTQEANTSGDNEGAELKDHTEVIVKVGKNQLFKGFTKLVLRIEPKVLLLKTEFIVKRGFLDFFFFFVLCF